MNSFFIPSLGGQIYAMPGMMTKLNLISNSPGKYKGISSNYSGRGFSNMKFTAISVSDIKSFENWIKKAQKSPKKLNQINIFNTISLPNENHFIEYFSDVKKNLFNEIVNQNYLKNKVFKH
jgi:cytochrome o ubiquinol oxidase subunit 2